MSIFKWFILNVLIVSISIFKISSFEQPDLELNYTVKVNCEYDRTVKCILNNSKSFLGSLVS